MSKGITAEMPRRHSLNVGGTWRAGPYSHAVRSEHLLFSSGQVGLLADKNALVEGGFDAEVEQVFSNLGAVLSAAGLDFQDVVKCTIYLTNVYDFKPLNEAFARRFCEPFPARTTVVVAALPLSAQVEIEVVAAYPEQV